MDDTIQKTEELNFNAVRELPPINTVKEGGMKNKAAKQKLKTAENRFKGKGRAEPQLSLPDDPENTLINLDAIVANPEVEPLTMEYMDLLLGKKKVDKGVKEKALEFINTAIKGNDPAIAEHFRNNCITVMDSMYGNGSKITLQDYINACLFVSYRAAGDTKTRAYCKVFPERVMRMEKEGRPIAHLNSYADIYSKGQAVIDIQAKTLVPIHLVCHDFFFQALRVSVDIMNDTSVSPKVRTDAANNVMNQTRPPEIKKQELEIKINESDEIEQLKEALFTLSEKQRDQIIEGEYSVVDVTKQVIYSEGDDE